MVLQSFCKDEKIPSTQPVCFKILPTNNFNLCHSNGKSHKFLQIIIPFNLSYTKRKVQNDFHSFSEGKMLITFHEVEFFFLALNWLSEKIEVSFYGTFITMLRFSFKSKSLNKLPV